MASRLTQVLKDFDGGTIQTSFDGTDFLADGSNYVALLASQLALRDAILAVTLGSAEAELSGGNYTNINAPNPGNPLAQTNVQWRLIYQDTVTGAELSNRVGTADLSQAVLLPGGFGGQNFTGLDLSAGNGATLKAAFDGYVLSDVGNAVDLIGAVYVQ